MNRHLAVCVFFLPGLAAPWLCSAADVSQTTFGNMPDGRKVEVVTLDDGHGFTARVISLGASLQSLTLPDRHGKLADVVLAYPDLHDYLAKPQYFGATVGRFANRIAKGRFTLDGKNYQLTINDGPNSLHGGTKGFDKVVWQVVKVAKSPEPSVTLQYVSPDGDQGYPGTLTATATYTLKAGHELDIDYSATTDKPTIVNLSNHTYWNLGGEGSGSVYDDILTIPGDSITPVDDTLIPTGEFRAVAGTDYDFRQGKPIGRDIRDGKEPQLLLGHGYDMNWVISRTEASAPRLVAKVEDPHSGRVLELYSAQPGLQFYSGNFLDGTSLGKSGRIYRQGDAFVLEPQRFPDTPNHPGFGPARLAPGQTYRSHIIYRFSVDGGAAR
ncbi:aldose epimerase family protein [Rhodanobacter sp. DHG33]|uniref:aldose epimerase family protein n=1 Tax=Rhodanobacter sp. DHG33 TaxID=2775921 RepID=UPI0017862C15|nr:aldose epimerase family protein [Rhodanobacter sp. DHG33]MBD8897524.1 galactose mutarotase [Rhodanobacter sp. DHG33]